MCWKSVKIRRICVGKMSKLDEYVLEKCYFSRLFLIKQHFFRGNKISATLRSRQRNVRHIETQRQVYGFLTLRFGKFAVILGP